MIIWIAYEIVTSWTESTPRRWRQSYEGRQPQCASFRAAKDDIRVVRRHSLTLKITDDTDCVITAVVVMIPKTVDFCLVSQFQHIHIHNHQHHSMRLLCHCGPEEL